MTGLTPRSPGSLADGLLLLRHSLCHLRFEISIGGIQLLPRQLISIRIRLFFFCGPSGIRTHGLLNAIETRSQLRYGPWFLQGLFYPFNALSSTSGPGGIRTRGLFSAIEARSQLRYRPIIQDGMILSEWGGYVNTIQVSQI
jgi:hypothetical protein